MALFMRGLLLTVALCAVSAASAQQAEDPRIAIYRQLLSRANDELAQAMAHSNALGIENAKLKTDLDKTKSAPPDEKK